MKCAAQAFVAYLVHSTNTSRCGSFGGGSRARTLSGGRGEGQGRKDAAAVEELANFAIHLSTTPRADSIGYQSILLSLNSQQKITTHSCPAVVLPRSVQP